MSLQVTVAVEIFVYPPTVLVLIITFSSTGMGSPVSFIVNLELVAVQS